MGILNLTPDSFYDGGSYTNEKQLLSQAEKHLKEGAKILDIGAYSSRPDAQHISEKEELERLLPGLQTITKHFSEITVSVDTFRGNVAKAAVEHGAAIINDISAYSMDENMLNIIDQLNVPYIMMHMQGTPQTMQQDPTYDNVVKEVTYFFSEKLEQLTLKGVNDIILDPGFGFGKTVEHNYDLLNNLDHFKMFGHPILVGVSRKSMICKVLKVNPEKALNGTTALNTIALLKGANILRVHDVKEAMETIKIVKQLKMS